MTTINKPMDSVLALLNRMGLCVLTRSELVLVVPRGRQTLLCDGVLSKGSNFHLKRPLFDTPSNQACGFPASES